MARYTKMSAIGARPPSLDHGLPPRAVADEMTRHLLFELGHVLPDRPDLIVLPEMCDLPANYNYADEHGQTYFRQRGDRIAQTLADVAREHACYITYPAVRPLPDGTFRNSIQLIDRRGDVAAVYDKYHPTLWELDGCIEPGTQAVVAECDFGRVGLAICFDLNFDELRLQYIRARPDLIIFSSMYHGGLMQNYWAYSCRAHFAGAITGTGGYIHSPLGEPLARSTNYFHYATATVNLDCCVAHVDYNLEGLTALRAKYGSKVKVFDPGYLGALLISSETDEFSALQMAQEFDIELLDDYFTRALARQAARRAK
jgi:predicted amidohydrolase